jgi:hypothetical protein
MVLRLLDDLSHRLCRDGGSPPRSAGVSKKPIDAKRQKTVAPQSHHARRNLHPLCNLLVLKTLSSKKNNPTTLHDANRRRAPARQLFQPKPGLIG